MWGFYFFKKGFKWGKIMTITSNKEQRLISLLRLLSNEKNVTVLKLSNSLNCSKSTILNDLAYFSKNWSDLINISISKNNAIEMTCTSNGITNKIIRDIIFNSLEIQFIKRLFLTPNQNIYYYAEKLFVSPATLYRIIKHLKVSFKRLGITIENSNKTYYLSSLTNTTLLIFLSKGLEEFYGLEIPRQSSQKEFDEFNSLYQYSLNEEQYFLYLIWGIINRSHNQNTMIDFEDFKKKYDSIFIPLNLDKAVDRFLCKASETFIFCPSAQKKTEEILSYCIKKEALLPLHEHLFINRHQSFTTNYAKLNMVPFTKLKKLITDLLNQLRMNAEFSFDYVLYLLFTHCKFKLKNSSNKNLYIYSDLGTNHGLFLKSSIIDVFSDTTLKINVVPIDFFKTYIYKTTDLIISTTVISNKIPTIFVDDYLCEAHFFRIRKELKLIH